MVSYCLCHYQTVIWVAVDTNDGQSGQTTEMAHVYWNNPNTSLGNHIKHLVCTKSLTIPVMVKLPDLTEMNELLYAHTTSQKFIGIVINELPDIGAQLCPIP